MKKKMILEKYFDSIERGGISLEKGHNMNLISEESMRKSREMIRQASQASQLPRSQSGKGSNEYLGNEAFKA